MTGRGDGITLDHVVIAVSDWETANACYRDVCGAELVELTEHGPRRWRYRFGDIQFNVHGPGMDPQPVARIPAAPGMADLCLVWPGTAAEAKGREQGEQGRFGIERRLVADEAAIVVGRSRLVERNGGRRRCGGDRRGRHGGRGRIRYRRRSNCSRDRCRCDGLCTRSGGFTSRCPGASRGRTLGRSSITLLAGRRLRQRHRRRRFDAWGRLNHRRRR